MFVCMHACMHACVHACVCMQACVHVSGLYGACASVCICSLCRIVQVRIQQVMHIPLSYMICHMDTFLNFMDTFIHMDTHYDSVMDY